MYSTNTAGITLSGLSKHFFQRNSRAFKRGTWMRRKIRSECGMHAMWHKTGNTLPVMVNGRQTGSKKVLVLHTNKNFNQQRTNWVMHQYHLGTWSKRRSGSWSSARFSTRRTLGPGVKRL